MSASHRVALGALVAGLLGIAAAYGGALVPGVTPSWAPWSMAVGTSVVLVALMLLGLARRGRQLGAVWAVLAFTLAVCLGAFGAALVLPPEGPAAPLLWGLPRRAAFVLYGIGALPLFVLPIAYALTFDRLTLSEADLEAVRRAARPPGAP
jgi:peptidoglycan/LPS O-acetylase OafA/YrhL